MKEMNICIYWSEEENSYYITANGETVMECVDERTLRDLSIGEIIDQLKELGTL